VEEFSCSVVQWDVDRGPAGEQTHEQMTARIRAAEDADIVVFPELATTGYKVFDRLDEVAEPVPGPTTDVLSAVARETGCHILFGMPIRDGNDIFNSAVWIARDGSLAGRYDKRCLWGVEQDHFAMGNTATVLDTDFARVGIQICYDLNFPEVSAALCEAGIDVLINIAAWSVRLQRDWETLLPARALECGTYVVGCNRVGREEDVTFAGSSSVFAPDGTKVAGFGDNPGQTTISLDPRTVKQERERNPMAQDRERQPPIETQTLSPEGNA